MLALVMATLVWPSASEAAWVTREVCVTGNVTGGDGSSSGRTCWFETIWETAEMIGDPNSGWGGGPGAGLPGEVPLPARPDQPPISCADLPDVRQVEATRFAATIGLVGPPARGRQVTIRWSTGAIETYIHNGTYFSQAMEIVRDSCISPRG